MKKSLVIMMIIALTLVATSVFAVTTISPTQTTTIGSASFIPSTGVTMLAVTDANGISYTATSQHMASDPAKGGVEWCATNGTSSFLKATSTGAAAPTDPGTAGTCPTTFQ